MGFRDWLTGKRDTVSVKDAIRLTAEARRRGVTGGTNSVSDGDTVTVSGTGVRNLRRTTETIAQFLGGGTRSESRRGAVFTL